MNDAAPILILLALAILLVVATWRFEVRQPAAPRTPPRPPKDPRDFTLTESSTQWETGSYCRHCSAWTGHRERMSRICNSCGVHDERLLFDERSARSIWTGERWVTQCRYRDGYLKIENISHFPKEN